MKKLEELPRDGTLYGYGTAGIDPHTWKLFLGMKIWGALRRGFGGQEIGMQESTINNFLGLN